MVSKRIFPLICLFIQAIIVVFLNSAATLYATEPQSDLLLRIETGMHIAPIRRIDVDAAERYLVSSSQDKTLRVWELSTGSLLKTLRVPIGKGNQGSLVAAAITPDGKTIAAADWVGFEWERPSSASPSIYVFDRTTGRMLRRITGLPDFAFHLTYSKDGRYLAAVFSGAHGIHVYETSAYRLHASDSDYGARSFWADFDNKRRLVTTSTDGFVRLYNQNFKLLKKIKAPGVALYSVSFSPDDSKIAVGYMSSSRVDVFSGRDLKHIYSANTENVKNNLAAVAWSKDGRFLYAAGSHRNSDGKRPIRKWSRSGQGSYTEFTASEDPITDLRSLRNGLVFASLTPSFGVIETTGKMVHERQATTAEFAGNREGLLISQDGTIVEFAYKRGGGRPIRFALSDRSLTALVNDPSNRPTAQVQRQLIALGFDPGPADGIAGPRTRTAIRAYQRQAGLVVDGRISEQLTQVLGIQTLTPPITKMSGLNITDWDFNKTPKVNGKALKLGPYQSSRCLAIAPDGDHFIIGTTGSLRLFDRNGSEKWSISTPGVVTTDSVNITGNGKLAVAALGDGTIHWYRLEDGKELLALFPHTDGQRWLVWTPSGYYDAATGADALIGWHKNNDKAQAADFFPAGLFRKTYYRPDMVEKVLFTRDEKRALALADEEVHRKQSPPTVEQLLPPVVNIVFPADGSTIYKKEVTIKYSLRNPSGAPVTGVKVLLDGRPVRRVRGLMVKPKEDTLQELRVTVPRRDVDVSLIAQNHHAASEAATVRLIWQGRDEEFIVKPMLYVLAVGVSKYRDNQLNLQYAAKDARDFAKVVRRQSGGLYRDVVVKVITDDNATKDNILDGLEWVERETTSKDVAMVFLAGHGVNDHNGYYYFLPSNVDRDRLKRTGVPYSDIKNTLEALPGKSLFFVDTCHAGNILGTRRGTVDIISLVNDLASAESGVVVFAASTGRQFSLEDPAWGNGAFTKALVEGLTGDAAYTGKGKITVNMLDLYLAERVKELTLGRQTPTTTKPETIPDFPVAIKP